MIALYRWTELLDVCMLLQNLSRCYCKSTPIKHAICCVVCFDVTRTLCKRGVDCEQSNAKGKECKENGVNLWCA